PGSSVPAKPPRAPPTAQWPTSRGTPRRRGIGCCAGWWHRCRRLFSMPARRLLETTDAPAASALRPRLGFGAKDDLQRFDLANVHVQRPPRGKRRGVVLRPAVVVLGPKHPAHLDSDREFEARQLVLFAAASCSPAGRSRAPAS